MSTPSELRLLNHLRWVGNLEGISFLLLLGVAMPLKYAAGMPLAVRFVGMAHGALFVWYWFLVAQCVRKLDWPLLLGAKFMVAALLPFGPFVAHRWVPAAKTRSQA